MPQGHYENKIKKWKNKAKLRVAENKKLRGRIAELIASRDRWKEKYFALKKNENSLVLNESKAFGHQYSLWLRSAC